jgi:dsDNA-specific endonuclease/ATPase MutS2
MTFKVGDKVKFLNDVGGGVITKIKQQTAFIETSDGFEIPAQFSELLKVEEQGFGGLKPVAPTPTFRGHNPTATPQPVPPKDEIAELEEESIENDSDDDVITSENCTLNIILALVPVKLKGRLEPDFEVYMISDCAYRMLYTFSVVKDNFVHGRKVGMVEEDTKTLATRFTMTELKQIQSFKINCIFYKKGIYLPHEPVIYEYKIDSLFMADPDNWEENDYFDEKAIIVNITEMSLLYEIERMVTETEDKFIIQKKKRDLAPKKAVQSPKVSSDAETEEVDLHIEKLVDDFSNLNAGEIVDLQMSRFTIALDGAIRGKTKKVVFIHGVGNGKLKYEIRKALDSKYPKLRYQDASFKEYGYGATMVIVR